MDFTNLRENVSCPCSKYSNNNSNNNIYYLILRKLTYMIHHQMRNTNY